MFFYISDYFYNSCNLQNRISTQHSQSQIYSIFINDTFQSSRLIYFCCIVLLKMVFITLNRFFEFLLSLMRCCFFLLFILFPFHLVLSIFLAGYYCFSLKLLFLVNVFTYLISCDLYYKLIINVRMVPKIIIFSFFPSFIFLFFLHDMLHRK